MDIAYTIRILFLFFNFGYFYANKVHIYYKSCYQYNVYKGKEFKDYGF